MPGYIRLKNKVIVRFFVIVTAVTLLSYYLLLPYTLYSIGSYYERKGMPFHAQVYYQRIIDYLPHKSDAIVKRGKHLSDIYLKNYHIVHYPNLGTLSRAWLDKDPTSREEAFHEAMHYFEESVSQGRLYSSDDPWESILEYMVPLLVMENRFDDAENLLNEYPGKIPVADEVFFRVDMALKQRNPEKALAVFHDILQDHPLGGLLDEAAFLGRGLVKFGEYKKAKEYYEFLLEDLSREEEVHYHYLYDDRRWIWENEFGNGLKVAESLLAGEEVLGQVKGRALAMGEPVAGVEVRLKYAALRAAHHKSTYRWGEPHPPVITDENGYYSFDSVYPGSYTIGLRIAPEDYVNLNLYTIIVGEKGQREFSLKRGETATSDILFPELMTMTAAPAQGEKVQGDIHFSWEPYPGATSYSLFLGGKGPSEGYSYSSLYQEGIRDTKITVTLEELYSWVTGSLSVGKEGVSMHSLLGLQYPKGEITWYIQAHDEDEVLWQPLSSTRPEIGTSTDESFFIPTEYNKAERFLMTGKTQRAAEEFKNILKEDPDNLRALRPLAYLYAYGRRDFPKDKEQAKIYFVELYRVTGKEWLLHDIKGLSQ